jgi:hypothetical protein
MCTQDLTRDCRSGFRGHAPTDGSLEKVVGGKNYHWCEGNVGRNHPPKWVIHKPSDCTNLKKTTSINRDYGDAKQRNAVTAPSWSTSMIAALQTSDEERWFRLPNRSSFFVRGLEGGNHGGGPGGRQQHYVVWRPRNRD